MEGISKFTSKSEKYFLFKCKTKYLGSFTQKKTKF